MKKILIDDDCLVVFDTPTKKKIKKDKQKNSSIKKTKIKK